MIGANFLARLIVYGFIAFVILLLLASAVWVIRRFWGRLLAWVAEKAHDRKVKLWIAWSKIMSGRKR